MTPRHSVNVFHFRSLTLLHRLAAPEFWTFKKVVPSFVICILSPRSFPLVLPSQTPPGSVGVIIGTLYKEMKLKPNILDECAQLAAIVQRPRRISQRVCRYAGRSSTSKSVLGSLVSDRWHASRADAARNLRM